MLAAVQLEWIDDEETVAVELDAKTSVELVVCYSRPERMTTADDLVFGIIEAPVWLVGPARREAERVACERIRNDAKLELDDFAIVSVPKFGDELECGCRECGDFATVGELCGACARGVHHG